MRLVLHGKSHFDAIVSLLSSTTKSWHFHEDGSFYIVQNDKNQGKFEAGTVFEKGGYKTRNRRNRRNQRNRRNP